MLWMGFYLVIERFDCVSCVVFLISISVKRVSMIRLSYMCNGCCGLVVLNVFFCFIVVICVIDYYFYEIIVDLFVKLVYYKC